MYLATIPNPRWMRAGSWSGIEPIRMVSALAGAGAAVVGAAVEGAVVAFVAVVFFAVVFLVVRVAASAVGAAESAASAASVPATIRRRVTVPRAVADPAGL
jgi:hypothetical protein